MAITVGTTSPAQGVKQFPGVYREMWVVTAALTFAAIAAGAEDSGAVTVPGVAVGDHVISFGFNADPEEDIFVYNPMVTADDTVTLSVTNLSASSDTPAPTEIKLLVGRPSW